MKWLFYRSRSTAPMAALVLFSLAAAACAPRMTKIDDAKLAGVPEERLSGIYEAKKEVTLGKAELAKAQDAIEEQELRLKIRRAAQGVAQAKAEQSAAEFALAKFKNENEAIVRAGEAERADELGVKRAEGDVEVARTELLIAQRKSAELAKKIEWLEAKHELERAKVALRYDAGSPNEKSVTLSDYERAVLETQLKWKDAEAKLMQAAVALDTAKAVRAALDTVK